MNGENRRRSARHLLGVVAEVHVGPQTVNGIVQDVSQHGMGLILPRDIEVTRGDTVWILANTISSFAITATVQRVTDEGLVGVEFNEVLGGDALDVVETLPLPMPPEEAQEEYEA
jgi:hypothetical protein